MIWSVVNDSLRVDVALTLTLVLHCVGILHRVVVGATESVVIVLIELDDLPWTFG